MRQALIEKNLSGVYSDEIFKEQNRNIEKRVQAATIAKDDELIEKYNLEAVTKFVKEKLGNIVQTYTDSDLQEKRTLMCSIFLSGLVWGDDDYSNTQISEFYTAILDLQKRCCLVWYPGEESNL